MWKSNDIIETITENFNASNLQLLKVKKQLSNLFRIEIFEIVVTTVNVLHKLRVGLKVEEDRRYREI